MSKKIIGLLGLFVIAMILAPTIVSAVCDPAAGESAGVAAGVSYCCKLPDPATGQCVAGYVNVLFLGCCRLDIGAGPGAGAGAGAGDLTVTEQEPPKIPPLEILGNIIRWAFGLILVLVVLMVIIAGYMFMTAGGSPERITTARKFLMFALIGLAIAVLARGLVALVGTILGYPM